MKSIYSVSMVTIILLGLGGCSATGQKFSGFQKPNKGKALVYFYRPDSFCGIVEPSYVVGKKIDTANDKAKVGNDKETIIKVRNNSFAKKEFDPAKYKFMISLLIGEEVTLEADSLTFMEVNNCFVPNIVSVDMEHSKGWIVDAIEMTEKDEEEIF